MFQAVTSNRNASDLFAGKWLRARDSNQQDPENLIPRHGDLKSRLIPYRHL
jgi:hypothetical protein